MVQTFKYLPYKIPEKRKISWPLNAGAAKEYDPSILIKLKQLLRDIRAVSCRLHSPGPYRPRRILADDRFASRYYHRTIRTQAPNGVDEWGSSDDCRLLIEID